MDDRPLAALERFFASKARLLVIVAPEADMDSLAGAAALGDMLKALGKAVTVVAPDKDAWPEPLRAAIPLQTRIQALRALHIRLPIGQTPLDQFSYEVRDQSLRIELLPKTGVWPEEAVAVESGAIRYDGLIALNVTSPSGLRELIPQEPEWLNALPTLHLTTKADAEPWAKETVPLLQNGSLCEAIYAWAKERPDLSLNADLVHTLLVGVIAGSDGFRSPRVQSQTLQAASELIERGADRQAIMNRLWRVRSVPTLNLWGRGFMRLSLHPSLPIATTLVTEHDFLQAHTGPESLAGLGRALLDRLPETRLVLVFSGWNATFHVQALARTPLRADLVARWFGGQGNADQAHWTTDADDLLALQHETLATLERELPRLFASH